MIKEQHFIKDTIILKCTSQIHAVQKTSKAQVTLYRTTSSKSKQDNLQRDSLSENLSQGKK